METLMADHRTEGIHVDVKPKVISVSKSRQITIPIKYYRQLGIHDEVECILRDGEIVIRPVKYQDDFSEEILKDLLKQGYSGDELLGEFQRLRTSARPAVERMLVEAREAASAIEHSVSVEDKIGQLFSNDGE